MSENMIAVKNLTRKYGETIALNNLSFEIKDREVVGFLGPNGAGKTTTMKILTCFIAPTKGEVMVGGMDIYKEPLEIRKKIGYLAESAPLYTDMQVNEYLSFVSDLRGIEKNKKMNAKERVFSSCGLTDVVYKEIRTLSKGYKQRVGLAQAIIHDPEILILDEPTSGLDPNQIVEIRELVKSLGRERTVILSTHNLSEVQAAANRVLIINKGKLVADGTMDELESKKGGVHYDTVICAPEKERDFVVDAFDNIEGVNKVKFDSDSDSGEILLNIQADKNLDLRADIFKTAVENKWELLGLSSSKVNLEAIFRQLTKTQGKSTSDKDIKE